MSKEGKTKNNTAHTVIACLVLEYEDRVFRLIHHSQWESVTRRITAHIFGGTIRLAFGAGFFSGANASWVHIWTFVSDTDKCDRQPREMFWS